MDARDHAVLGDLRVHATAGEAELRGESRCYEGQYGVDFRLHWMLYEATVAAARRYRNCKKLL